MLERESLSEVYFWGGPKKFVVFEYASLFQLFWVIFSLPERSGRMKLN